jgi:hypothetical protein
VPFLLLPGTTKKSSGGGALAAVAEEGTPSQGTAGAGGEGGADLSRFAREYGGVSTAEQRSLRCSLLDQMWPQLVEEFQNRYGGAVRVLGGCNMVLVGKHEE